MNYSINSQDFKAITTSRKLDDNLINKPQQSYKSTPSVDTYESSIPKQNEEKGFFSKWGKAIGITGAAIGLTVGGILVKKKIDINKAKKLEEQARKIAQEQAEKSRIEVERKTNEMRIAAEKTQAERTKKLTEEAKPRTGTLSSIIPIREQSPEDTATLKEMLQGLKTNKRSEQVEINIAGHNFTGTRFLGTQSGSNRAYMTEIEGRLFYVKYPNGATQATEEVLASKLYKSAGIDVPNMELVRDKQGKVIGVASEFIPNLTSSTQNTKHMYDSFAVDAWLNNWDAPVIGNTLFGKNGAVKIDVGGSLRYRAQGGYKELTDNVESLYTLVEYNPYYYNKMSTEDVCNSIKHVTEIPDEKISEILKELKIDDSELLNTLIKRKHYLQHVQENLNNPDLAAGNLRL